MCTPQNVKCEPPNHVFTHIGIVIKKTNTMNIVNYNIHDDAICLKLANDVIALV